jgi:hypothetical protein
MKILERNIKANFLIRITDKKRKKDKTISVYDDKHDAEWFKQKIVLALSEEE